MPRTQDSRRIAKSPGTGSPPPPARNVIRRPRLKFRADRSVHSLDQLSSVPTRSSIANIYTTEHAALIFIACKLLRRPRCISVVFATIGPIFRGIRSAIVFALFLPFTSLSLFAFFTFPLRPCPSFSIRLRHGSARTEWRKRNSRSSRDNEFSDVLFFRGDSEDRGGANGNVVGARGERRVAKSSGLNMHVTRRPCGTWRSGLFQAPRTQEVNTELVPACGNRRLQDVYVISPFFACISVDRPPASPPFAVSSSPPRALNLFTDAREERFIMPPLMDGRRRRENATRTRPRLLDPFDSPSTPKSSFVSSFFFLLFFSLLFFPPEPLSFTRRNAQHSYVRVGIHSGSRRNVKRSIRSRFSRSRRNESNRSKDISQFLKVDLLDPLSSHPLIPLCMDKLICGKIRF